MAHQSGKALFVQYGVTVVPIWGILATMEWPYPQQGQGCANHTQVSNSRCWLKLEKKHHQRPTRKNSCLSEGEENRQQLCLLEKGCDTVDYQKQTH